MGMVEEVKPAVRESAPKLRQRIIALEHFANRWSRHTLDCHANPSGHGCDCGFNLAVMALQEAYRLTGEDATPEKLAAILKRIAPEVPA